MMLDWNTYRKQLLPAIAEIGRTSPETPAGLNPKIEQLK
jgi:hypothetical protein